MPFLKVGQARLSAFHRPVLEIRTLAAPPLATIYRALGRQVRRYGFPLSMTTPVLDMVVTARNDPCSWYMARSTLGTVITYEPSVGTAFCDGRSLTKAVAAVTAEAI